MVGRAMLKMAMQALACPFTFKHEGYEFLARRGNGLANAFAGESEAWGWWMTDLGILDRLIRRGEKNRRLGMISVNLSPETMCHNGAWKVWLAGVDRLVQQNPMRVVVEVSERELCDDRLAEKLSDIRAIGAFVALDDLDAQIYPRMIMHRWDIIKIDWRSSSRIGGLNLECVIKHCQEHQVISVLEGVETPEDIELARGLGVDLVQGHGVHRPMLID